MDRMEVGKKHVTLSTMLERQEEKINIGQRTGSEVCVADWSLDRRRHQFITGRTTRKKSGSKGGGKRNVQNCSGKYNAHGGGARDHILLKTKKRRKVAACSAEKSVAGSVTAKLNWKGGGDGMDL